MSFLLRSLMPLFSTSDDVYPGFQHQGETLTCMLHHALNKRFNGVTKYYT